MHITIANEPGENKSQLAKELAHALYVCHLRDLLAELVEDARIQDSQATEGDIRTKIHDSYAKATVLLACVIQALVARVQPSKEDVRR